MLTAAAFALEVAYAVISCYAIPVLLETGLQQKYAGMIWAIPPVLGVLCHGYLGSASDRCSCSWGRRRPFILGLALIGGISVAMFAYGKPLAEMWFGGHSNFFPYIVPVSFVIMDFSLDVLQSPVRMYLLDSVPLELSDKANYIYSSVLALGAVFGALVGAIDWEDFNIPGYSNSAISTSTDVTHQMRLVFGMTLCVFVVCVLITLCSVKEQRIELQSDGHDSVSSDDDSTTLNSLSLPEPKNAQIWISVEHINGIVQLDDSLRTGQKKLPNITDFTVNADCIPSKNVDCIFKEKFCICRCVRDIFESIHGTWEFIRHASKPTLLLLLMTFLDWFVLLTLSIFFSDYVGEVVYGGSPASDKPELTLLYAKGVRMSCCCVVIESVGMFVYSLLLERMSKYCNHNRLLLGSHLIFLMLLGVLMFSQSIPTLFLISITEGVLFGNLCSIPYALIPYYKVGWLSIDSN